MHRLNRGKFMNSFDIEFAVSEEKARLFERLHDFMCQESIRTNHTPLPKELEDPAEWRRFCHWKAKRCAELGEAAWKTYETGLNKQEQAATLALAETPPPYPSKS